MKIQKMIKRVMLTMILLVTLVCAGTGLWVVKQGYDRYQEAISAVSLAEKAAEIRAKDTYTEFEDLPDTYVNAIISVEDHRFYSHPGIDPIAIGRALLCDLRAGAFVQGGSTITQQLAKNFYFSGEKELTRKVAEVFLAFDLERNYSKDEILEMYVNTINFGDGYDTVREASEGYFGKLPQEMNDYESTLLAGIPNAPSRYAPTKNQELSEKRQKQVLSRMVACGYFTDDQAETAAVETLAAEALAAN